MSTVQSRVALIGNKTKEPTKQNGELYISMIKYTPNTMEINLEKS